MSGKGEGKEGEVKERRRKRGEAHFPFAAIDEF